jgi:NAD(P)-dependent dehydrogenase (short-subunit alcohol dehydrogenase family)
MMLIMDDVGRPLKLAARFGSIHLTGVLAKELGLYGITVNAVYPGYVETPALRASSA